MAELPQIVPSHQSRLEAAARASLLKEEIIALALVALVHSEGVEILDVPERL